MVILHRMACDNFCIYVVGLFLNVIMVPLFRWKWIPPSAYWVINLSPYVTAILYTEYIYNNESKHMPALYKSRDIHSPWPYPTPLFNELPLAAHHCSSELTVGSRRRYVVGRRRFVQGYFALPTSPR